MPHFNGSKQGKQVPVKKIKPIKNGEHRGFEGGEIIHKPIIDLQYNIPKGVADDKRIKPSQVFVGFNNPNKKTKKKKKK